MYMMITYMIHAYDYARIWLHVYDFIHMIIIHMIICYTHIWLHEYDTHIWSYTPRYMIICSSGIWRSYMSVIYRHINFALVMEFLHLLAHLPKVFFEISSTFGCFVYFCLGCSKFSLDNLISFSERILVIQTSIAILYYSGILWWHATILLTTDSDLRQRLLGFLQVCNHFVLLFDSTFCTQLLMLQLLFCLHCTISELCHL